MAAVSARGDLRAAANFGAWLLVGWIPAVALFGFLFRRLYPLTLRLLSPLDAAACARPIVEREAALQVDAERTFYGREECRRLFLERSIWADTILQRERLSPSVQRRAVRAHVARTTAGSIRDAPLSRRLPRYAIIAGSGMLLTELLVRWTAWFSYSAPVKPFQADVHLNAIGLGAGLLLGCTAAWLYVRQLEGLWACLPGGPTLRSGPNDANRA
ncbi:MAG: hypothetical protein FJ029_14220 [Actinobacteria bacterium]|nr:hypothetical protein [Actinomycetota bacterium]